MSVNKTSDGQQMTKSRPFQNLGYCSSLQSGNFGHQVDSDLHLQTVEIQMRRLLMSRLIRIFLVCLVYLFLHSNNLNTK